jgi:hypothetical protein
VSLESLFEKLRTALEAADIPYFVSGSFASAAHGVPRSTNDIDIVIAPTEEQVEALLRQFPSESYATDLEDARDAFARKSLFNVVDYSTSWKVDFIVSDLSAFDLTRFARKSVVNIAGVRLYAASPEDILVTKLWWAKLGESERQIRDAAGILTVQGRALDWAYIEKWVGLLQLEHQWSAARDLTG